ncbi:prestalk protein-like [Calliphora vicina]|uniref:prestalk protein-like n=1 Tax=Calliphora vicina TaxID=7373 RepID=UPI00325C1650
MLALSFSVTRASTCGKFECHENANCGVNHTTLEQYCDCKTDYTKTELENNVYCCSKVEEDCAVNRKCSSNLKCKEIGAEDLEESKELDVSLSCPESEKCPDKCCAVNEICSVAEKKCVSKDNSDENNEIDSTPICPAAQKCQEKCCAEDEECDNETSECVPKESQHLPAKVNNSNEDSVTVCDKCPDKCCAENEICSKADNKCVSKDTLDDNDLSDIVLTPVCPAARKCLEKCCAEDEECDNEASECVSKDTTYLQAKLDTPNDDSDIVCDKNQQCADKCCAENEICSKADNKCVSKVNSDENDLTDIVLTSVCPAARKCQEKCCAEDEECDKEANECVSKDTTHLQAKVDTPNDDSDIVCNANQQCSDKCCAENEICSVAENKCVPADNSDENDSTTTITEQITESTMQPTTINNVYITKETTTSYVLPIKDTEDTTVSSLQSTIADNNVKFTQTASTDESTATEEVTTASMNCPLKQKCLNKCCSSHELCNDQQKCVNSDPGDFWDLFGFSNEEIANAKTTNKQANNDIKPKLTCHSDQQLCHDQCCSAQQTCNDMQQCIAKTNVCSPGQICAENAKVSTEKAAMAYTMIGSGILVATLAFGAFKLYDFRRSKRNLY